MSGILILSCYSHKKVVDSSLPYSDELSWPKDFKPSESSFFVHNQIDIKAPPQVVWDLFINAEKWPEWYEMAEGIKLLNASDGKLSQSTAFRWYPQGHEFISTVKEFEPPYKIAWYAEEKKKKMLVYHGWLFVPTEEGCRVISDESQNGPITFWEKIFTPNMVEKSHRKWLEGLKELAESKHNLK